MKCCMGVLHEVLQGIVYQVLLAGVDEKVHEVVHPVLSEGCHE